ncbi:hypothetical protein [Clostridium sp. CF012]|uniref:hypothetical protein n=1 Tax=Clostridium sp. CF012 TaxID=2843319 RepID=UPI001C0D6744|nr:hypothetical protein [Clostridium sp. CF012]MBU3143771.1 hypothetical protein [Clostridium sp. CF012]
MLILKQYLIRGFISGTSANNALPFAVAGSVIFISLCVKIWLEDKIKYNETSHSQPASLRKEFSKACRLRECGTLVAIPGKISHSTLKM